MSLAAPAAAPCFEAALPAPADGELEPALCVAHFPLEGGPPRCDGPSLAVVPGVTKQLLCRGRPGATRPPPGAVAFAHVSAWSVANGEEVESVRGVDCLQVPLSAPARNHAGLAAGLASMRPGERALLRVCPDQAYGSAGSFSFPAVAPHAELLYDVTLLLHVARARRRADMMWEERMEAAEGQRLQGNARTAAGDHPAAGAHYAAGLSYVDESLLAQLSGAHEERTGGERCALLLNASAAAHALGDHDRALRCALAAAGLRPDSAKAQFRAGRAHAALGQDAAARDRLHRAKALAPADPAVAAALRALDAEQRAQREAAKHVFAGLFGDASATKPSQAEAGDAAATPPLHPPAGGGAPGAERGLLGRLAAWLL